MNSGESFPPVYFIHVVKNSKGCPISTYMVSVGYIMSVVQCFTLSRLEHVTATADSSEVTEHGSALIH